MEVRIEVLFVMMAIVVMVSDISGGGGIDGGSGNVDAGGDSGGG